jgi:glucose-1-phosphate adenylyltransferase
MSGGVFLLPPYSSGSGMEWYSGTANSIYQNRRFIDGYDPEYLLVLSGDHVYKMDYSQMMASHKKNGADCTIAVIEVPIKEASRYGIINTGAKDKIVEFEEKPEKPKSNLASMGVYVFNWRVVREYLEMDDKDEKSSKDFGKNVLPAMLAAGQKMYAYRFKGYWKDVGTLESLWEANMDILDDTSLGMRDWLILSRSRSRPPHHINATGRVRDSILASNCQISGTVEHSVLSRGVVVEKGAVVRNSVVMSDAVIKAGAVVEYSILDERSFVAENAVVGKPKEAGGPITVVPGAWG